MKSLNFTAITISSGLLATLALHAEDKAPDVKTDAYRTSLSQEQLRSDTTRVKAELGALLEEYGQYRAAAPELAKLKDVAGELDLLQDQDMRAVVQILREASRLESAETARTKVVEASVEQKTIQTRLQELADRLSLQKAQAAMRERLESLALRQAANLRQTQRVADTGSTPHDVKWDAHETAPLAQAEQKAISAEVAMVSDSLKYLAATEDPKAAKAFSAALAKVDEAQLKAKAQDADRKMSDNFQQAADTEKQILGGLKTAIATLDAERSKEERDREMAEKLSGLAEKEKALTQATTQAWSNSQNDIRHDQEAISDQAELAQAVLQQLNGQAAATVSEAHQTSEDLVKELNKNGLFDHVDSVAKATDSQTAVARKLEAASDLLQKEATELAKQNPSSQGQNASSQAANSPADKQAAEDAGKMREMAGQLESARQGMQMANRQIQQKGDQNDTRTRLDRAAQELHQAEARAQSMGEALPKDVGEHISKASEQNNLSREGIGKGDPSQQEQSRWKLDEAQREVDRALASLQNAANQMALQQQQQQRAENAKQASKPMGNDRSIGGKVTGNVSNTDLANTDIIAGGKRDSGQREALSLLQQEKAPAEYEEMVQQYIRNLAKGELPAK
jgi:hypothetical protein